MPIKHNSEDLEHINYVNWFEFQYPDILIMHVPNGGKRNMSEAIKLKQMGVKAGVPDLFVPAWMLWVEMKRKKGGRLSKEQKELIPHLESIGYTVIVAKGFEDAKEQTERFIKNEYQKNW